MIIGSRHNLGKIDKDPVIKIDSETVKRVRSYIKKSWRDH